MRIATCDPELETRRSTANRPKSDSLRPTPSHLLQGLAVLSPKSFSSNLLSYLLPIRSVRHRDYVCQTRMQGRCTSCALARSRLSRCRKAEHVERLPNTASTHATKQWMYGLLISLMGVASLQQQYSQLTIVPPILQITPTLWTFPPQFLRLTGFDKLCLRRALQHISSGATHGRFELTT